MASKEFVIELRIPLSGDEFAQAETVLVGKTAVVAIEGVMSEGLDYTLKFEIVNRREKAVANGAAAPRRRKTVETQAPLSAGQ